MFLSTPTCYLLVFHLKPALGRKQLHKLARDSARFDRDLRDMSKALLFVSLSIVFE